MKAIVWNGADASLSDVPIPRAKAKDVVIKVEASGICRTDVTIARGHMPLRTLPITLGHQPAGIVSEIGEGVTAVGVGDRVVSTPDISCFDCPFCLTGRTNLCRNLERLGFEIDGSDAEYVLTAERSVIKLPDDVPFSQGAVAVDAVASMYHALIVQAQVKAGEKVVALGIGGMGIQAIEMARMAGASVLATSRDDKRLQFAEALGADFSVNVLRRDLASAVREYTGGEGADIVINSIGIGDTMQQALGILRPGGKIIVIGTLDREFSLPYEAVVMLEARIIGSRLATKMDVIQVLRLIAAGKLHPAVTASFPLSEYRAGFDAVESGGVIGRAVLIP